MFCICGAEGRILQSRALLLLLLLHRGGIALGSARYPGMGLNRIFVLNTPLAEIELAVALVIE